MYRHVLLLLITLLCASISIATAQVIDNFDNGDISAWNTAAKPAYYTTVSAVSPGAGEAGQALAIQEAASGAGVHSQNALVHRVFSTAQDWSGYVTLQLDAKISAGDWNGYSIAIYNAGSIVLTRGLHATTTSGFVTLSFDISGIARNQINELVVYVNKTNQNAGQVLTLDNIRLSTTPVSVTDPKILQDFESTATGDISYWTNPISPPYGASAPAIVTDGTKVLETQVLSGATGNALIRWTPAQTMDWTDYKTLQFDAKVLNTAVTDGYSIRLYNNTTATSTTVRKFVPGTSGYVTCQVDISNLPRDQVNQVIFYINRTSLNGTQTLRIDNIRLTKTPVPATPDVLMIDDFNSYTAGATNPLPWDWFNNVSATVNHTDFLGAIGNSFDLSVTGSGMSNYARRSFVISGATLDMTDYKSLQFEAKAIKGTSGVGMTTPVGFLLDIVNGNVNDVTQIFHPTAYSADWQTMSIDITGGDVEQAKWLRFYVNRCGINDIGQILRIENLRLSKEPAPPATTATLIDDFESGSIGDWYYVHAVTDTLKTDPVSGNHYLEIANGGIAHDTGQWSNTNASAYTQKMIHANWSGYKTLSFDARLLDSNTSMGFTVRMRDFNGGYQPEHTFTPSANWKTYKIDISGDTRSEVIDVMFYVNHVGMFGTSQNGAQKLQVDNIRLTNDPVPAPIDGSIGQAKVMDDGTPITLTGKISMGVFPSTVPDPFVFGTRDLFVLEEPDRSAAVVVMKGSAVSNNPTLDQGSVLNVTGTMASTMGIRFLYATSITNTGTSSSLPKAIALTNKNCGSAGRYFDHGVTGFTGLDTTGMYVNVSGRVVGSSAGSGIINKPCLYIDDGSGVPSDNGNVGIKLYDTLGFRDFSSFPVGTYVTAQGIVMNDPEMNGTTATGNVVRSIWLDPSVEMPIQIVPEPAH